MRLLDLHTGFIRQQVKFIALYRVHAAGRTRKTRFGAERMQPCWMIPPAGSDFEPDRHAYVAVCHESLWTGQCLSQLTPAAICFVVCARLRLPDCVAEANAWWRAGNGGARARPTRHAKCPQH